MNASPDILRYPVGHFTAPDTIDSDSLATAIATLAEAPALFRRATHSLSVGQLDTPYREGGWTVRQLVHHVADSHMNAFIRMRLALTEDWPTVKPYDEAAWAELQDSAAPIELSLDIIEALHTRWVILLNSLDDAQWKRGFIHPEGGPSTLDCAALNYAWHSRHHLAHISHLKKREGW